jgi:hypothetical protein
MVVEIDWPACSAEYERSRDEELRVGVGILLGVERALRERRVLRLPHEAPEPRSGDWRLVHPEAADRDPVHGALLGIEVLGAHRERTARDPAHAGCASR